MTVSVFGESNARLQYVLDFIQGYFNGLEFKVVPEIPTKEELAINYTQNKEVSGLWIEPSGLLEEFGIGHRKPELGHLDEDPVLFRNAGKFGFDVFSAVFYMISRYEEYNELRADKHGRFPSSGSIAHSYGFLEEPVVDHWVEHLAKALEKESGKKIKRNPSRKMIPSVDVDVAWAYKHRSTFRMVGAHIKDALAFDLRRVRTRTLVMGGRMNDPYDTFSYIEKSLMDLHEPLVFFLLANYGRYDKNIPHDHPKMRALIKRMDLTSCVGIHPSYASFKEPGLIKVEKKRLEEILDRKVEHSRFHFLRFRLPYSYRQLVDTGITHDHSMGYADAPGFRAGTSRPFYFYDIDREEKTKLLVHPFVYMDGTLNQYQKMSADEAMDKIDRLFDAMQYGNFEFIWHNSTLNEKGIWDGWRRVFKHTLDRGKKWERSEI